MPVIPQRSACLHLSSTEITSAHHHTKLLHTGFAGHIQPSGSGCTASACLTEPSPSSRGCFKVTGCWREPNHPACPSVLSSSHCNDEPQVAGGILSVSECAYTPDGFLWKFRLVLLHPGMPICLLNTESLPLLHSRSAVYLERVPVHSIHSWLGLGIGRQYTWVSLPLGIQPAEHQSRKNKPTTRHLVT